MAWLAYPGEIQLRKFKSVWGTCPAAGFDPGAILRSLARGGGFTWTATGHWQAFVDVWIVAGGLVTYNAQITAPFIKWGGLTPGWRTFWTWGLEFLLAGACVHARSVIDGIGQKAEGVFVGRYRSWQLHVGDDGVVEWGLPEVEAISFGPVVAAVGQFGYLKWLSNLWVEI